MEVVDLTDDNIDASTFHFPFLFGQSLVKPIINKRQIDEFYELKKVLDTAEILVIFGFNINEDDNHINSFLHDFVSTKKIIIVNPGARKIYATDDLHNVELQSGDQVMGYYIYRTDNFINAIARRYL